MLVSPDEVFKAAQALRNQAYELNDGVAGLSRDWDSLSRGWSGAAASAFAPAWEDWHQGVTALVAMLADWSDRLARAAVAYEQQDCQAAGVVGFAGVGM
ncbi:MAG: WXG100 family type VII secretion target [Mycobacteriaceae bacterium]|nr:WXG100 family type VII secretion target [Mycobacteriaceae bacterium]